MRFVFSILVTFGLWAPAHALTVVELFTSQGCSSCPPADQLLGELAQRDDVLALSFHVKYWDRLGWTDPHGSHDATKRQRAYASALNERSVFTPQMIIDGKNSVVGSRRQEVLSAISQAGAFSSHAADITFSGGMQGTPVSVHLAQHSGALLLSKPADIWLIHFKTDASNAVDHGENIGRTLSHVNIVESIERLDRWDGTAKTYEIDNTSHKNQGIAVLIQSRGPSDMIAAAKFITQ